MLCAKWQPFCSGLQMLTCWRYQKLVWGHGCDTADSQMSPQLVTPQTPKCHHNSWHHRLPNVTTTRDTAHSQMSPQLVTPQTPKCHHNSWHTRLPNVTTTRDTAHSQMSPQLVTPQTPKCHHNRVVVTFGSQWWHSHDPNLILECSPHRFPACRKWGVCWFVYAVLSTPPEQTSGHWFGIPGK